MHLNQERKEKSSIFTKRLRSSKQTTQVMQRNFSAWVSASHHESRDFKSSWACRVKHHIVDNKGNIAEFTIDVVDIFLVDSEKKHIWVLQNESKESSTGRQTTD